MRIAIELTEAQADELRTRAKRLGLAPEELASAAVAELLNEPESDSSRPLDACSEKTPSCIVGSQDEIPRALRGARTSPQID